MNLIVKPASAYTSGELAAMNITGIPSAWPIESYEYIGQTIPLGFVQMTDAEMATLKNNNQASYDAWLQTLRPVVVLPPANPTNSNGVPLSETALRRSTPGYTNFTICTHDFSDRTTWYQRSVQVTNETLFDTGGAITYQANNAHWVNMNGQKLTIDYKKVLERDGTLSSGSKRAAIVKSNGTTLIEGTDYIVNYPAGTVQFTNSQAGNTITATYWHNNNVQYRSEFLFTPPPNYLYRIEHIESQFSANCNFNNSAVVVEIWAGAVSLNAGLYSVNLNGYANFNPAYYDAGYGQSRSNYRNMNDLFNWCDNAYPPSPPCGNITQPVMNFCFFYAVHPEINSKQGTCIRFLMANDVELTAEICTTTLYMEKGPS